MMAINDILALADRYGTANDLTRRQVSWRVFNDTNKLDALFDGGDLTTRRYSAALDFFSGNWPDGVEWPEGIARPAPDHAEAGPDIIGGKVAAVAHDGETAASGSSGHVNSSAASSHDAPELVR
jgi:hypothetical protein